eukprot:NODE_6120_length_528_cov_257.268499.p2 GENE.NODE_6120_length_528_cov_257.268499~~NODE_6120_length_528_cov_257.268499.p2  ORF type:complete len:103 (-),score=5.86 NODE_6120_length_528_cov_257.268499:163-471(-)
MPPPKASPLFANDAGCAGPVHAGGHAGMRQLSAGADQCEPERVSLDAQAEVLDVRPGVPLLTCSLAVRVCMAACLAKAGNGCKGSPELDVTVMPDWPPGTWK